PCGAAVAGEGAGERPAAASLGRRAIAWLVDVTIVWVVPITIASILVASSEPAGQSGSQHGPTGVGLLLWLTTPLYSALLHRFWHGQTLGKRLAGIRVVSEAGTPIG